MCTPLFLAVPRNLQETSRTPWRLDRLPHSVRSEALLRSGELHLGLGSNRTLADRTDRSINRSNRRFTPFARRPDTPGKIIFRRVIGGPIRRTSIILLFVFFIFFTFVSFSFLPLSSVALQLQKMDSSATNNYQTQSCVFVIEFDICPTCKF